MTNSKQQTGRTTRMLAHARSLRDQGRAVYVLVHSKQYGDMLALAQENKGLRFETFDSLGPSGLDERRMTLRAAHPNCVLLVDHHAVEARYAAALRRMCEYDIGADTPALGMPRTVAARVWRQA